MNLLISPFLLSSIVIAGSAFLLIGTHASAQITPDNTLGTERSRVTPNAELRDGRIVNQRIDGGAQRGENLFHSFREFNVGNLESVYFSNPAGVRNILTRVTGRNYSDIQGILGVDGRANLFLLNPNGILFGENAQLDLQGSFLATTADRFVFPDRFEFGVNDPQAPPLLTVTTPIGLQYGNRPNPIVVDGSTLLVDSGESLVLAGGDVFVNNANLATFDSTTEYPANGGQIVLGAVQEGRARLSFNRNSIELLFPGSTQRSNAYIDNSFIRVAAMNGGDIVINIQDITISNSRLRAGIAPIFTGIESQAGNISLNASGEVNILQSEITNSTPSDQSEVSFDLGNSGNISITSASLDVNESIINVGTSVSIDSLQTYETDIGANAGNIIFDASDDILINNSLLSAGTLRGEVGSITINSEDQITLSTSEPFSLRTVISIIGFEQSNSSKITINADGNIILRSSVPVYCLYDCLVVSSSFSGQGNAGEIEIKSGGNIAIIDDSPYHNTVLSSSTSGEGNAGSIYLVASGTIRINGSQVFSSVQYNGIGEGGEIIIDANSLRLNNNSRLQTSVDSDGRGNAGAINIQVNESVQVTGHSTITSEVRQDAIGDAGRINIRTPSLEVRNQAELIVDNQGTGRAGNLEIVANIVNLENEGRLSAETDFSAGGDIELDISDSLTLDRSSSISASTNEGQAGQIGVNLDSAPINLIQLLNNSSISSQATGRDGDAGAVSLNTLALDLQRNSIISAATISGEGGNIQLRGLESLDVSDSEILASTRSGAGGDIRITALDSIQLDEGSISVEARDGTAGDLILNVAGVLSLDNDSQIRASARGEGDAGDIGIVADTLNASEESQIQTTMAGSGDAGDIRFRIANDLNLDGIHTGIFASTQPDSSGDGGTITGGAEELNLQNRAAIAVTSQGTGEAGDIEIQADSVNLRAHASLSAETNSSSGGNIGLQIADSLLLDNSSEISASTNDGRAGQIQTNLGSEPVGLIRLLNNSSISSQANGPDGDAGTVNLNTLDLDLQGNSVISATTISGDGGNIRLRGLENLNVTDSEILASTRSGAGGDIRITALDSIQLDDQGNISAEAEETGRAGDLQIRTEQLAVQDSSEISVSSPAGEAGSLAVNADVVELDRGFLRAEVGGENASGAEISLNLAREGLELRNNSQITARAENNANGGNVTINAPNGFVLAPSGDNDIIANAFLGQGGNIEIASQAIFGFAERPAIPGNGTNDIDASSQFGSAGTVTLDSPVDPVQQVVELPEDIVDATNQIRQDCPTGRTAENSDTSSFVATGRGGLPPNPTERVETEDVQVEWYAPDESNEEYVFEDRSDHETVLSTPEAPILEAQAWTLNPNGQYVLIAEPATASIENPAFTNVCP